MDPLRPYNPLDKKNLGDSIADALLERPTSPLPPKEGFNGAGIYAIYYVGEFDQYAPIVEANRGGQWTRPIYVGKAIPKGGRKGGQPLDARIGPVLYKRLKEHAKSIDEVENLSLSDFFCRYFEMVLI